MNRMSLLPLLLLVEPAVAQSLKERIEAEATELVAAYLSDTVETTLISEGRQPDFATCVGEFVANSFSAVGKEQRENSMRTWIDEGKRQCSSLRASTDQRQVPPE